ncbi:pyridoxal-phosphate dependent enzyme [Gammaproteobacteria bacterium]|nr:pyridoxal-phosphate dependent enzyme [Gammaproteobacteria bacterium]
MGNIPVVKLQRLAPANQHDYAKLKAFNPLASVKDRLVIAVIDDAENKGSAEATANSHQAASGNTGFALAMVCAVKGIPKGSKPLGNATSFSFIINFLDCFCRKTQLFFVV